MSETSGIFLETLAGRRSASTPIWLMRQAGRYLPEYRRVRAEAGSFLDLCYNPDLATEVTLQPIRRFGFDAAILFSDILVVPHGLGQEVAFREGEGPVLERLDGERSIDQLSPDRMPDRLAPVYQAVGQIRSALPRETALIGFAGSPWTVATYMVEGGGSKDFGRVKALAFSEPTLFARLINILEHATVRHLSAQIDAGVQAVQLFDSWAGVLPPDAFESWVTAPTQRIVSRLKQEHPAVPVIGFPRQAGLLYPDYVTGTGIDGISLDSTVPLQWAAAELQSRAVVQGNLDSALLFAGGDAMLEAASRIREAFQGGPHIFNLGHGVMQHTPPDNVARLVDHLRALDAGEAAA
ncbi:MAG: uroporphyrinogen decarboxylase [Pseudomonadota bacterium]